MNKRALSAILALILSIIASPFLAVAQEKKEVLVVVGTISIDKGEFLQLMAKERESESPANSLTRKEFEENFESFLNYKLKVIEAESIKLDQLEEFNLEFSSIKESLIAPYLIKNSIEEGEVKKVFARLQEIVRAKHILFQFPPNPKKEDSIAVLQLALKVKSELENGGDFSALAANYSDDPSAKVNKGDLGYFTGLQMVQQFEEAAYTLPVGSISDPILTDFGYHIIQVSGRQANPGEVQVSHILVRFDSENPSQEENARRKISDIYAEIQKESTIWEEIVQTYSEDFGTKSAGGVLPWFGVGTMIPEFEVAGFSLTEIGEVSPPIKTAYGVPYPSA
jgi:peptidyl-prolyl cis-trans isomerase SurA